MVSVPRAPAARGSGGGGFIYFSTFKEFLFTQESFNFSWGCRCFSPSPSLATSASFIINCLILSSLVVFLKSVLFYFWWDSQSPSHWPELCVCAAPSPQSHLSQNARLTLSPLPWPRTKALTSTGSWWPSPCPPLLYLCLNLSDFQFKARRYSYGSTFLNSMVITNQKQNRVTQIKSKGT